MLDEVKFFLFKVNIASVYKDFVFETITMSFPEIQQICSCCFAIVISAAFTPTEMLKWVILALVLFSKIVLGSKFDEKTSETMFPCLFQLVNFMISDQIWNICVIYNKQQFFYLFWANFTKKKKSILAVEDESELIRLC